MRIAITSYNDPRNPDAGRIELFDDSDNIVYQREDWNIESKEDIDFFLDEYKRSLAAATKKILTKEEKEAVLNTEHAAKLAEVKEAKEAADVAAVAAVEAVKP